MSKWTLEQIFKCKEVKFGTKFTPVSSYTDVSGRKEWEYIVLSKEISKDSWQISWANNIGDLGKYDNSDTFKHGLNIRFYRDDGTEILPPKYKKKIQVEFWVNVYKRYPTLGPTYESKEDADTNVDVCAQRISCEHFEREIEVDEY